MRWIACLAACLVSASALAATLQVSPVRITISADGKAGVVRLQNQSDVPTLVQVEALVWNDGADLAAGADHQRDSRGAAGVRDRAPAPSRSSASPCAGR